MSPFDLLPPLSRQDYEALKADIAARGVQVPVEYDEQGNILDGHHRVRACQELGIKDWPRIVRVGLTEEEKIEHALTLNLVRRHLSREQRRELVLKLRQQGWSLRRIAERVGVSDVTVLNDLRASGAKFLAPALPDRTIGADGKRYPARKPAVIARNAREHERIADLLQHVEPEALGDDFLDTKRAVKKARSVIIQRARQEMARQAEEVPPSDRWQLWQADIRTWQAPRQYDFIITDPPYPREYLPLYETLAKHAAEWLAPGGLLVVMVGLSYLDEIIAMMTRHLDYYWTACYLLPEQPTPLRRRAVNTSWKPLLMLARKGDEYRGKIFGDVFTSPKPSKDHHDWEQSTEGMLEIVRQLCLPGQWILDPFVGSGTTGVAALRHGCLFHGIDTDEGALAIARRRLYDTESPAAPALRWPIAGFGPGQGLT